MSQKEKKKPDQEGRILIEQNVQKIGMQWEGKIHKVEKVPNINTRKTKNGVWGTEIHGTANGVLHTYGVVQGVGSWKKGV